MKRSFLEILMSCESDLAALRFNLGRKHVACASKTWNIRITAFDLTHFLTPSGFPSGLHKIMELLWCFMMLLHLFRHVLRLRARTDGIGSLPALAQGRLLNAHREKMCMRTVASHLSKSYITLHNQYRRLKSLSKYLFALMLQILQYLPGIEDLWMEQIHDREISQRPRPWCLGIKAPANLSKPQQTFQYSTKKTTPT